MTIALDAGSGPACQDVCFSILIPYKELRIDARAIEVDAPVQVGSGGDAGAADSGYWVAFFNDVTGVDFDLIEVKVDGGESLAVVDDDGVAVDVESV